MLEYKYEFLWRCKMKFNSIMDLDKRSISYSYTPSVHSQRLPFYVHSIGHFYAKSDYLTEREGLDNYLLFYTISGSGYIKTQNLQLSATSGSMFIIYCGDYQCYGSQPGENWEFKFIHFNGTSAKEYFDLLYNDGIRIINIDDFNKMELLINNSKQLIADEENNIDIKMSYYITAILTEMILAKNSPINNKRYLQHKNEIDRAIKFMQENYHQDIKIEDIAQNSYMSKYYFLRIFKSIMGVTPYEYLINYRINSSKKLLVETELSVFDISLKVGFFDCNNFIRSFKKIVGTTPLGFKKTFIV